MINEPHIPEPMRESARPNAARRVLGTALITLGMIACFGGIVMGILYIMFMLPIALLFNLIMTPAGTYNWPLLYPLAGNVGLTILGWILLRLGTKLRA